jgi:hypothetical protein
MKLPRRTRGRQASHLKMKKAERFPSLRTRRSGGLMLMWNHETKHMKNPAPDYQINKLQIFIGAVCLLIGALVYLIDRPPDFTYFVYRYGIFLSLHDVLPRVFGPFADSLPDFIHTFSFILLTAGILSCGKKAGILISISWLLIDSAFELGQLYSSTALKLIPEWFSRIPFLEATVGYFRRGTFDFNDIAAVFLGAVAACFVVFITMKQGNYYEQKEQQIN